ncbi:SRPBCC family protein [Sphingosinicella sp. BN140058]|uniref:SRPBCC family protein n=1 Tax=Sphingosinicella sp. BN140058 TaxID=1892855 RepID=UPI0010112A09|nr:SRPBCC family protein [Sphingosinicella sp. BN140058]QAY77594.1 SRPBCC family protein [Sphingosinicella sp. BN140058]
MPTVHHEITIARRPAAVWEAARDVGALHTRLVPAFVTDTQMLADTVTPTRRVTFASGTVADEVIVSIDDERRRLVWSVLGVEHHNGALQIFAAPGGSRVTWTADVLPAAFAARIDPMMGAGLQCMKAFLEGGSSMPE